MRDAARTKLGWGLNTNTCFPSKESLIPNPSVPRSSIILLKSTLPENAFQCIGGGVNFHKAWNEQITLIHMMSHLYSAEVLA